VTGTGTPSERIHRHQHAAEVLRARSILVVACTIWLVLGAALDDALVRALDAEPSRRPDSADELARLLGVSTWRGSWSLDLDHAPAAERTEDPEAPTQISKPNAKVVGDGRDAEHRRRDRE